MASEGNNNAAPADTQQAIPVNYAIPTLSNPPSSNVAAGLMLAGGVALIVVGGCFCVGIMVSNNSMAGQSRTFIGVLYAMAFLSFAAGALLIYFGVRTLLRIANR